MTIPSNPGDSQAGRFDLVLLVDLDEQGGHRFEQGRVFERPDIDRTNPERANELADPLFGGSVIAAQEAVGFDRVIEQRELVRRDLMKRGHDFGALAENRLRLEAQLSLLRGARTNVWP